MNAAREPSPGVTDVAGARPDDSAVHLLRSPDTLPTVNSQAAAGDARWYAVWVLSNAEFVVEDALRGHDIQAFLPSWLEVTQWSDRKKTIRRPLFPGYVFARCEAAALREIPRIAGVIEILPSNLNPAPVDAAEIDNIARALASGRPAVPCQYITGDAVIIDSGPLAGVKGIVQRSKNGVRVVVKIELLQRAVSVEVDARELVKAA
jgi:transcription termination/antitermination protein NusG